MQEDVILEWVAPGFAISDDLKRKIMDHPIIKKMHAEAVDSAKKVKWKWVDASK